MAWWRRTWLKLRARIRPVPEIPSSLWLHVLQRHPFLQALSLEEKSKLRALSALFLHSKQFSGANGLVVDDRMALTIAAQACVPLLYRGDASRAIAVYDDFVGIVVHPGTMVATRDVHEGAGLVSQRRMMLEGEAMERGPVTLSWAAIDQNPTQQAERGTSVVIHEFCHKIDMASGEADGCPPLPSGFMGHARVSDARAHWLAVLNTAFEQHAEQVEAAERFGQPAPWLDAYGAESLAEFFPVACEGYFTQRARFAQELPELLALFDALFRPSKP